MKKINVLYISNQGGGAPKSLLNMIHLLEKYVNPIVLFENKNIQRNLVTNYLQIHLT